MIQNFLIKTVKKPFQMMGLDVVRFNSSNDTLPSPPPARAHPLESLYSLKNQPAQACAFNCDINWCTTEFGFGYGSNDWHPFVATLREYINNNQNRFQGSILDKYYKSWQPANAKETLLRDLWGCCKLSDFPPVSHVVPWATRDISKRKRRVVQIMESENRKAGFPDVGFEEGYNHFGPVSDRKGQIEILRLIKIYYIIKNEGYKRTGAGNGDIRGYLLRRGDQFRFLIYGGYHRLAAVAALGYESIPVRFDYPVVIQSQDVEFWPQVQRGVWEKESAVEYFNWLFTFDSKKWARDRGLVTEF